jgi:hypothetical protein
MKPSQLGSWRRVWLGVAAAYTNRRACAIPCQLALQVFDFRSCSRSHDHVAWRGMHGMGNTAPTRTCHASSIMSCWIRGNLDKNNLNIKTNFKSKPSVKQIHGSKLFVSRLCHHDVAPYCVAPLAGAWHNGVPLLGLGHGKRQVQRHGLGRGNPLCDAVGWDATQWGATS